LLSAYDLRGLAVDLKLGSVYEVLYRRLSQDAHPQLTALEHHLRADADGGIEGLHLEPDFSEFADTLLLAVSAAYIGLHGFAEKMGTPEDRATCSILGETYRVMDVAFNSEG